MVTPWTNLKDTVTSILFCNGVKGINFKNFAFFSQLKSVSIPNSVRSIGPGAFFSCDQLRTCTIPKNVQTIGWNPFACCTNLTSVFVDIDNPYFISCEGIVFTKDLTSVVSCPSGKSGAYILPDSVINVLECAFWGCRFLNEVIFPENWNLWAMDASTTAMD